MLHRQRNDEEKAMVYAKRRALGETVMFPYVVRKLQMFFHHNKHQGTDVYANKDIFRQKFVSVVLVCWGSGNQEEEQEDSGWKGE